MKRLVSLGFTFTLVAGLGACSSSDVTVASEPAPAGPSISLSPRMDGDEIVVDVVGKELPAVSGVALRIDHPTWMHYARRDVGAGWKGSVVHDAKSMSDHDVALVDVAKGAVAAHEAGGAVLTTLRFTKGDLPSDLGAIKIVPVRSEVRDETGRVVKVSFAGASFSQ